MRNAFEPRRPLFKSGDNVVVTGPGKYRHQRGTVIDIIEPFAGDFVYRYRVRLADGTLATFFGFELNIPDL
jgi:hypothetical protein